MTVPVNKESLTVTVPVNNLFLKPFNNTNYSKVSIYLYIFKMLCLHMSCNYKQWTHWTLVSPPPWLWRQRMPCPCHSWSCVWRRSPCSCSLLLHSPSYLDIQGYVVVIMGIMILTPSTGVYYQALVLIRYGHLRYDRVKLNIFDTHSFLLKYYRVFHNVWQQVRDHCSGKKVIN